MSAWGSLRFIVEDFEAKLKPTATHKAGQAASGKVERERYKGGEEEFDLRVYKLELLDGTA